MNDKLKYRFSNEWISKLERELHWRWYWQQQKLMEGHLDKDSRIGEIGVGSKFTYNYLSAKGYNIKSIDIDEGKNPDIVENIVTCNDEILKFDTILAFNIFEHIPYSEFIDTIVKLKRNKVKQLFIGLPMHRKTIFDIKLRLGRYFDKQWTITIPKSNITTDFHHWELGYNIFKEEKLISDLLDTGYDLGNQIKFKLQAYFHFVGYEK